MDNVYYVYGWIREDYNSFFYIGKGKGDRYKVLQGRSKHFLNIINSTPCRVEFLGSNLTEEEAFKLEIDTIDHLINEENYSISNENKKRNKGKHLVNQTYGGEGASGRVYQITEETRMKLKLSHIGIPNKNKGGTSLLSEEGKLKQKIKLRENAIHNKNYGMKGKNHTVETKQKLSKAHTGKKLSPEHVEKIVAAHSGEKHWTYNKPRSEETKQKISETLKGKMVGSKNPTSRPILCITTGEKYESCRQACLVLGISPSNLCRALKNNKKIKGYEFKYLN